MHRSVEIGEMRKQLGGRKNSNMQNPQPDNSSFVSSIKYLIVNYTVNGINFDSAFICAGYSFSYYRH